MKSTFPSWHFLLGFNQIQWLVYIYITFHFIKVVTSSLGNDSSSKTYVWVYKLSMFHLHFIHNFLLVNLHPNLHPFNHLYQAFIHLIHFYIPFPFPTKKRTTIWRWRHVISETKRFAPLVINLKNYNLLLILSQVLFSFGWKLKTPNFHIFHIFLRCFAISFCFYKYYSTFYRWWQRSCTTLILMMIVDTIF